MTRARSSNISDYALFSCLSSARLDLSAEDDAVALVLAECPARPYSELIKSGIPGPSSLKPARPAALRPSPPSSMRVSPIGPSAATPTRGELLAQLETLSRKPRSVKRKKSRFAEKGRPALAKVPRLGASSSSLSTPVQNPERAPSPTAEVPIVLSSQPLLSLLRRRKISWVDPPNSCWRLCPLPYGIHRRRTLGRLLVGRKSRRKKLRNKKSVRMGTPCFLMLISRQAQSRPF